MSRRERFDADDLEYEKVLNAAPAPEKERCKQTGKISWRKASKAANVAKTMRNRWADLFIEHYLCRHCGLWHTGHALGTPRLRGDVIKQSQITEDT